MAVVGEAADGAEAIRMARQLGPVETADVCPRGRMAEHAIQDSPDQDSVRLGDPFLQFVTWLWTTDEDETMVFLAEVLAELRGRPGRSTGSPLRCRRPPGRCTPGDRRPSRHLGDGASYWDGPPRCARPLQRL